MLWTITHGCVSVAKKDVWLSICPLSSNTDAMVGRVYGKGDYSIVRWIMYFAIYNIVLLTVYMVGLTNS